MSTHHICFLSGVGNGPQFEGFVIVFDLQQSRCVPRMTVWMAVLMGEWGTVEASDPLGLSPFYLPVRSWRGKYTRQTHPRRHWRLARTQIIVITGKAYSHLRASGDGFHTKTVSELLCLIRLSDSSAVDSNRLIHRPNATEAGDMNVTSGSKLGNWCVVSGTVSTTSVLQHNDTLYSHNNAVLYDRPKLATENLDDTYLIHCSDFMVTPIWGRK